MDNNSLINLRKLDHIRIVLEKDVDFPGNCKEIYESIVLIHKAFPEMDLEDVDLTTEFLGYTLNAPLMITGMTGGPEETIKINEKLAKLAETHNIAIGVGSQRPLLKHPDNATILRSYRIVREIARDVPVIGNIGANTLQDVDPKRIVKLVELINADAMAIHLNPGQEAIQPEGDTRFNVSILEKIEELLDLLLIPIIIKEVGNGLSLEVVKKFSNMGIRYFDVAGACGTNWILVEKYRQKTSGEDKIIAEKFSKWGLPTPFSIIEARYASPQSTIIASGGVWDGVRAIKNIVIGADLNGLAKPILKKLLLEGYDSASKFIETYIKEMKLTMFLIGATNLNDAKRKPVILLEPFISYFKMRGINLENYLRYIRAGVK